MITLLLLFMIAYALNFVWESIHYPLYNCKWPLGSCALVTSFRDAIIIVGIFLGGGLVFRDFYWPFSLTKKKIALFFIVAFFIAYGIELQGLYLGKWEYNALMPIIPLLNVGVSPILQMLVAPLVAFFLVKKIMKKHIKEAQVT